MASYASRHRYILIIHHGNSSTPYLPVDHTCIMKADTPGCITMTIKVLNLRLVLSSDPCYTFIDRWILFMQRDDGRFEDMRAEVSLASVLLAIGLMLFGISALIIAWFHTTEEILGKEGAVSSIQILTIKLALKSLICFLDSASWWFQGPKPQED